MSTIQEIFKNINLGIKTDINIEQILKKEIDDWLTSQEHQWMLVGQRYYFGDKDILDQKNFVTSKGNSMINFENLLNYKLVNNIIRKLVDQKIGYLLSKPVSIQTKNKIYSDLLEGIFNKSFFLLLKKLMIEAVNKGKAWLHLYYDENGKLSFTRIPSEEIIPFWHDEDHTLLEAIIRVYEQEVYLGIEKQIITKVEFWDKSGIKRYELRNRKLTPDVKRGEFSGHFSILHNGKEQLMNWEQIPFICFKYNDKEIPLIKFIKPLIDDYGRKTLDNFDNENLEDFQAEAFKNYTEQIRRVIYEFGRGVLYEQHKIGNSPNQITLKLLYANLDLDANIIEAEFQESLGQLLWFVNQHLANTIGNDYNNESVEFIFNRDINI